MFYQKDIDMVLKECQTSIGGLTTDEVKKRQLHYGYNIIHEKKNDHPIIIFIKQFQDLLVIILIIAAIISGVSQQFESTIVIILVVIVNAILGTIQAVKAQQSLESLKKLSTPQAKVLRDGHIENISSQELTIGDIVFIEAGDMISCDGRLIQCTALKINESTLTGEVESVDKNTHTIHQDTMINDRKNMVFSGSLVTNGTGQFIVTAIGMNTEMGKIASLLNVAGEKKTPLQKNLDDFSKRLSIMICIICLIVFILNILFVKKGLLDSLMIAVALAVAAIPEALSSIVTIVLSLSTQKMAKENAIIKNLSAVESLGCISVICSDKTGTLTQNKMTLQYLYFFNQLTSSQQFNHHYHDHQVLLKACLLCNNATIHDHQKIGDPTELALLDFVNRYQHKYPEFQNIAVRQQELPFDSNRKLMSVSSQHHLYTKGAPDVLLKRCRYILINGKKEVLSQRNLEIILIQNQKFADEGLRVLGFAYKEIIHGAIALEDENDLTFIGLVALIDPPRQESYKAVLQCRQAGIQPIMITGDHVMTARSIAKKIGIFQDGDLAIDGKTLNQMSDDELAQQLSRITVYARVAPEHKMRIIKAWQKQGQIVAMTGDGVNDAPALKQSDIGVAMGKGGTEVAKDAASMILTDDCFSTIVKAIMTGRNVYHNIQNSIHYLLSGNFAGIICVLLASLLILPTPFYPVHLLFMNLITDSLPAIAIGMETSFQDVLKNKPRKAHQSLLNKVSLLQISYDGFIIAICTMCAYLTGLKSNPLSASTMAFATICIARLLHGFNCRSDKPITEIGLFSNHFSILAFLIGFILLHVILLIQPLHSLFMIQSISLIQLLCIYAFSLIPTLIIQLRKMFQ